MKTEHSLIGKLARGIAARSLMLVKLILGVLFLVSSVWSLQDGNFLTTASSIVAFLLVIFSRRLHDKKGLDVSQPVYFSFLAFIFLSIFLGEFGGFYQRVWWWDLFLHFQAGILLGLIGFSLTYLINRNSKNLELNPFFVAFFGFCFSMTLSVLWEFFEFIVDMNFGTNMLKSGLQDTFGDLAVAMVGAIGVSFFGYLGLKHYYKKTAKFFRNLIRKLD